ncbi:hypothetical protein ACQEVI_09485 [Promicromonospora sp. CA-289599]|uniref:hypothetical protein n=1 Tax=Promicromonospora sp. CA-289599 TaxID=3240014 RepID=UPI003D8A6BD4
MTAAAAAVTAAFLLVGCQSFSSVRVEYPGTVVGSVIPDMGLHESMTFGDITLCIDGSGSEAAQIDSVEVPEGSTLEITAFSVADQGVGLGNDRITLIDAGFDPDERTLTRPCSDKESGRLIVEASRSTNETASADELIVHYSATDGGSERTLRIPYAIALCAPGDEQTEHCT